MTPKPPDHSATILSLPRTTPPGPPLFRDSAQRAAVSNTFLEHVGKPLLFTLEGPMEIALDMLEFGCPWEGEPKAVYRLAWTLWDADHHVPLMDIVQGLGPERLRLLAGLLAAVADGHAAIDTWLAANHRTVASVVSPVEPVPSAEGLRAVQRECALFGWRLDGWTHGSWTASNWWAVEGVERDDGTPFAPESVTAATAGELLAMVRVKARTALGAAEIRARSWRGAPARGVTLETLGEPRAVCGLPRIPVCSDCLGVDLRMSMRTATCPQCKRTYSDSEVMPCPRPTAVRLTDPDGGQAVVCESHARHQAVTTWTKEPCPGPVADHPENKPE
jgi:hypothetical protein